MQTARVYFETVFQICVNNRYLRQRLFYLKMFYFLISIFLTKMVAAQNATYTLNMFIVREYVYTFYF